MRRSALLLATLIAPSVLALAACDLPLGPVQEEGPPRALAFHVGGFGADGLGWTLRGDTVLAVRVRWDFVPRPDTARAVPGDAAWREFWEAVDRAGVVRWRSSYSDTRVADGEGWSLHLEGTGIRVRSEGGNAWPDRDGRQRRDARTAAFRDLLEALQALAPVPPP
jgi:hypothetical protein